ncbi:hypothetical protein HII36_47295 [Nonomuraea sp. NN258]|uniref:hypothetical protein n=1 Tax=Nonomuraea antri TaxID=2730852 RepID=UPI001567D21E|nr:hypothetical protein [Nonomuraea antri]NRQ39381.1 hypothetical protein [Nonomuraea antri]
MITPFQVVVLLWVASMALAVAPTMHAMIRLIERDPARMCQGCRARRRSNQDTADAWAPLGPVGPVLMILASAALWWCVPLMPLLWRLSRREEMRPCAGPSCAAHARSAQP